MDSLTSGTNHFIYFHCKLIKIDLYKIMTNYFIKLSFISKQNKT